MQPKEINRSVLGMESVYEMKSIGLCQSADREAFDSSIILLQESCVE